MIHRTSLKKVSSIILTNLVVLLLGLNLFAFYTPAQAQVCGLAYTVQYGDDLFQISLKFGVTISALQAVNGIANANLIYVGEILCVPNGTAPAGTPEPFPYHGYPVYGTSTPTPYNYAPPTADIGGEPPINAIGNFLEICGDCSSTDVNATQRQFRQNTLVCASVKPVPGTGQFGWYRVNPYWCGWYPGF